MTAALKFLAVWKERRWMKPMSRVVRVCPAECRWITAGASGFDTSTLSWHHKASVVQKIKIKPQERPLQHKTSKDTKKKQFYWM